LREKLKFKIDENLPADIAFFLNKNGHDAMTVNQENFTGINDFDLANICKKENRVLITLDLDFSDIRTYPPSDFSGIIVMRLQKQDKKSIMEFARRVLSLISIEPLQGHLWILDETKLRIRE
jgi:predicted nuclease of predicted toxin-antitoxin system